MTGASNKSSAVGKHVSTLLISKFWGNNIKQQTFQPLNSSSICTKKALPVLLRRR